MDLCSTAAEAADGDGNVAKAFAGAARLLAPLERAPAWGACWRGLTITRAYSYSLADSSKKGTSAQWKRQQNSNWGLCVRGSVGVGLDDLPDVLGQRPERAR